MPTGGMLDEHVVSTFVGRREELAFLAQALRPNGPVVTFVHGVPGVGTSALLERFVVDARRHGAAVVTIDCRSVEPTPAAVRALLADSWPDADVVTGRTVVLLDHWASFRLLDAWFRLEFVPALPASTTLVIADDRPPSPAWRASPDAAATVRELHLDVLPREDALALLEREGIRGDEAERILARTRGLPLALQVAASSAGVRPFPAADVDVAKVASVWGEAHLASLRLPLRHALEAIAVARRGTAALVEAAVPGGGAELLDELASLPFVRVEEDGLVVHPAIRPAVIAGLRSVDPQRHLGYRRIAWELAERSVREADGAGWRPIADLLHLVDHPLLHDAIFPATEPIPNVEPAMPADLDRVVDLARASLPPACASGVVAAVRAGIGQLRVARTGIDDVAGALLLLERTSLASEPFRDEPTAAAVREHLRRHPVPATQEVLFVPAVLSRSLGAWPDDIAAALWLDMKRAYLERRARLRRVYAAVYSLDGFLAAASPLGFVAAASPVEVDGEQRHLAVLDLGSGGVDGWLARLAADQVGAGGGGPVELDPDRRVANVRGREVALSRLEYGVAEVLVAAAGRPVSRQQLIRDVWGYDYTGGSNVVDAVVRTLRRKLGDDAPMIAAVRGVGYRYDAAAGAHGRA